MQLSKTLIHGFSPNRTEVSKAKHFLAGYLTTSTFFVQPSKSLYFCLGRNPSQYSLGTDNTLQDIYVYIYTGKNVRGGEGVRGGGALICFPEGFTLLSSFAIYCIQYQILWCIRRGEGRLVPREA